MNSSSEILAIVAVSARALVEAARHATVEYEAQRFVIVADLHYHALGLYESRAGHAPWTRTRRAPAASSIATETRGTS